MYPSVVIQDADVDRPARFPAKHDPPLVVDPDGIPSGPVTFQRFQPVSGRHAKVPQFFRLVQVEQFSACRLVHGRWETPERRRAAVIEQIFRQPVAEGSDHSF